MNKSNVLEMAERFIGTPPIAPANDHERFYTKFYVVNSLVEFIYVAIKTGRIEAFVKNHLGVTPVNFIDFLEMNNHGNFDSWENAHLIVDQGHDITIMRIVNNIGVSQ